MPRRILVALAVVLSLIVVISVGGDDGDDRAADPLGTTTLETSEPPVGEGPADLTTTTATTTEEEPDTACVQFREHAAPGAPCDALVRPAAGPVCAGTASGLAGADSADTTTTTSDPATTSSTSTTSPAGTAGAGCGPVPSAVIPTLVVGAVVEGEPVPRGAESLLLGPGPGPVSTVLVIRTGLPVQLGAENRHTFVVRYEGEGPGCSAPGEPWDGATFAAVLRAAPGEPTATDVVCRGEDFAEISTRTTWYVAGDLLVVQLPVDLPGVPVAVTGSFVAGPDFNTAPRSAARVLDQGTWNHESPIGPA